MENQNEGISLKDLLAMFLPKLWLIALCGVICAGVMGVYSLFVKKDTYTASSIVYVYNDSTTGTSTGMTSSDISIAKSMVSTYSVALKSYSYLQAVAEALPTHNLTAEKISKMVSIKQQDQTEAFSISVTASTPEVAVDVATKMADLTLTQFVDMMPENCSVSVSIWDRASDTANDRGLPKADSKHTTRNCLIGLLVGIVLSMVVIFIASSMDIIIHDRKRLEDAFPDIPVLGCLPRYENLVDAEKGELAK